MKRIKPIFIACCVLLTAFFWAAGCATSQSDPLASWEPLYGYERETFDKAVKNDYQSYINGLPDRERGFVGPIQLLKNENGQHSVRIEIARNGTDWAHVLIYDAQNKRVKVIKYVSGHYRS